MLNKRRGKHVITRISYYFVMVENFHPTHCVFSTKLTTRWIKSPSPSQIMRDPICIMFIQNCDCKIQILKKYNSKVIQYVYSIFELTVLLIFPHTLILYYDNFLSPLHWNYIECQWHTIYIIISVASVLIQAQKEEPNIRLTRYN